MAVEPDAPEISVIVPMHDVAAHAGAAIRSLRDQSFGRFEAIVIDDGSTDATAAVAEAAIAGDPRFRLIRQTNHGLSAARNTGLALARGGLVAFLDGDDRLAPEFLGRMHGALLADGGPWVACAVEDCWPDGRRSQHPAIHGQPMPDTPRRWTLAGWGDVIAHYPSAWNKLYRRDLIGDTRFAEGLWFEDHAFYMELAARAGWLLHLPEALYRQTRGRPGQITGTDSERVFDQFAVLDGLRSLMDRPALPDGPVAFAQLAGRLLAERAPVLRDVDRRARWLEAARGFLGRHGIGVDAVTAASPSLGVVLDRGLPVTVVVALPGPGDPADSIAALAAQDIAGLEIVLAGTGAAALAERVQDACPGRSVQAVEGTGRPWTDWAAGAAVARGATVTFWQAGDGAEPIALRHWADALLSQDADMAISAFRAPFDGGWRDGWADASVLSGPAGPVPSRHLPPPLPGARPFHPLPMARLLTPALARALLAAPAALDRAIPLDAVAAAARLADLAPTTVWVDFPGAWPAARPRPAPSALVAAVVAQEAGDRRRTATRALRAALDLGPPARGMKGRLRLAFWLWAGRRALKRAGLARAGGALDPAITPRLRRLWGLG